MSELVEDLLLLARLDQGRPLDLNPVDVALLAADAVSDAQAADASHRWALDVPPEPLLVCGDEHRLRQVLANLLSNARIHTPPGTSVRVGVQAEGPWAVLAVHDDGPGFPPDLLPRAFDRFTRADVSRSRDSGGVGLGLAIVAAVVSAHRGEVMLRSVPGDTTMLVRLPRDGAGPGQPGDAASPARRASATGVVPRVPRERGTVAVPPADRRRVRASPPESTTAWSPFHTRMVIALRRRVGLGRPGDHHRKLGGRRPRGQRDAGDVVHVGRLHRHRVPDRADSRRVDLRPAFRQVGPAKPLYDHARDLPGRQRAHGRHLGRVGRGRGLSLCHPDHRRHGHRRGVCGDQLRDRRADPGQVPRARRHRGERDLLGWRRAGHPRVAVAAERPRGKRRLASGLPDRARARCRDLVRAAESAGKPAMADHAWSRRGGRGLHLP